MKPSKRDLVADTLEALKLYQSVLQMLLDACLTASLILPGNSEASTSLISSYRTTLKALWMDYLRYWQHSHNSTTTLNLTSSSSTRPRVHRSTKICSIGGAFTRASDVKCTCSDAGYPSGHALLPSKSLLLGFVYLTFRVMRSDVLIADILRWIECGAVPYANLWEALPPRWREGVMVDMRWFYDRPVSEKQPLIAYDAIHFAACSLAQTLRPGSSADDKIALPPLNAPLVARRIVTQLGLPEIVWQNFCAITQLGSAASPLIGADMSYQHYEERVMAVMIVAVKLCPSWTMWTFLTQPPSAIDTVNKGASGKSSGGGNSSSGGSASTVSVLGIESDVSQLPRHLLPPALAEIRRTHQGYTELGVTKRREFRLNGAGTIITRSLPMYTVK